MEISDEINELNTGNVEFEEGEMKGILKKKRLVLQDKTRMRNLKQYKDLTDDQFDEIMIKKAADLEPSADFEKRIQIKLKEFSIDYDITDLKINDKETLRALIQAIITLEDYEQAMYKIRQDEGITATSLITIDKISSAMNKLRSDISMLQNDLKIARKTRKSDQEISLIAYIDNIKQRAKKYYEQKAMYVFCPHCNMLVATLWCLYPEINNKLELVCKRDLGDGTKCNTRFTVSSRDMLANRGTNNKNVMPESLL